MALILSIESSTAVGSVALLRDGEVLGLQQYHIAKSHSSLLHVMVQQITANAGVKMKDLSAVAVAEGPGSYTGLRIGVSAAKGFCFALDAPLIAVNTLEALAFQVLSIPNLTDWALPHGGCAAHGSLCPADGWRL